MSFHKLRHLNASTMAYLGVDRATAKARGGWKTSAIMDDVYTHSLKRAAEVADQDFPARRIPVAENDHKRMALRLVCTGGVRAGSRSSRHAPGEKSSRRSFDASGGDHPGDHRNGRRVAVSARRMVIADDVRDPRPDKIQIDPRRLSHGRRDCRPYSARRRPQGRRKRGAEIASASFASVHSASTRSG